MKMIPKMRLMVAFYELMLGLIKLKITIWLSYDLLSRLFLELHSDKPNRTNSKKFLEQNTLTLCIQLTGLRIYLVSLIP